MRGRPFIIHNARVPIIQARAWGWVKACACLVVPARRSSHVCAHPRMHPLPPCTPFTLTSLLLPPPPRQAETVDGVRVDISLNSEEGVKGAAWLRARAADLPALRPLCLALRALLAAEGLGEASDGGLGCVGGQGGRGQRLQSCLPRPLSPHPRPRPTTRPIWW